MKNNKLIKATAIAGLTFSFCTTKATDDFVWSKLLPCIGEFESGNDDKAVGRKGEVSRYQLSVAVIADWNEAHQLGSYQQVAFWHAKRCLIAMHELGKIGPDLNYYEFYIVWNGGISAYKSKNFRGGSLALQAMALRFSNLCQTRIDGKINLPIEPKSRRNRFGKIQFGKLTEVIKEAK